MFKINGIANENPFELDGFEDMHDALEKIERIATDFYGIGVQLLVTTEQGDEFATGRFFWPHRDGVAAEGEWTAENADSPRVSESVRELLEGICNVPTVYAWHGEDDELPCLEMTTDADNLDGVGAGTRGAYAMESTGSASVLDKSTYNGEYPRWFEVPATAHDDGDNLIHESNYYCLVRDFGMLGLFIEISYGRNNGGKRLAIPVNVDIPEDLTRTIATLADEHAEYDSEDHSNRESEARDEHWDDTGLDDFIQDVCKELEELIDFEKRDDFPDEHVDRKRADEYAMEHGEQEYLEYHPDAPGGDSFDMQDVAKDLARVIAEEIRSK
ncbi:hypothetical protein [Rhodococcus sp. ACS1]|uniref:hypothetical protein n=1 Tax=Rhodococcus sp. ACS1 TaxID=2028570 RepID=UPI00117B1B55|nr:hypothetical protein [Rhodococcus sp. ACS1]